MKIQVIGAAGEVGSTIAFALMIRNSELDEIILSDIYHEKLKGVYKDLLRVEKIDFIPPKIVMAKTIHSADVHIICAGRRREKGEDDLSLYRDNYEVLCAILEKIRSGRVIIVTNPARLLYTNLSLGYPGLDITYAGEMVDGTKIDGMEIQELTGASKYGIACEVLGMV